MSAPDFLVEQGSDLTGVPLLASSPPRGEKKFKDQDPRVDNVSSRFGVPVTCQENS
jgi:hypothetical protein